MRTRGDIQRKHAMHVARVYELRGGDNIGFIPQGPNFQRWMRQIGNANNIAANPGIHFNVNAPDFLTGGDAGAEFVDQMFSPGSLTRQAMSKVPGLGNMMQAADIAQQYVVPAILNAFNPPDTQYATREQADALEASREADRQRPATQMLDEMNSYEAALHANLYTPLSEEEKKRNAAIHAARIADIADPNSPFASFRQAQAKESADNITKRAADLEANRLDHIANPQNYGFEHPGMYWDASKQWIPNGAHWNTTQNKIISDNDADYLHLIEDAKRRLTIYNSHSTTPSSKLLSDTVMKLIKNSPANINDPDYKYLIQKDQFNTYAQERADQFKRLGVVDRHPPFERDNMIVDI